MVKNIFNAVKNFVTNSVLRARANCSKILTDKEYFNAVKISGQTLFSGQAQVVQNSE